MVGVRATVVTLMAYSTGLEEETRGGSIKDFSGRHRRSKVNRFDAGCIVEYRWCSLRPSGGTLCVTDHGDGIDDCSGVHPGAGGDA